MKPVVFDATPGESEELARAEAYGLLAALFYAAPSEALYAQLQGAAAQAPESGTRLAASFGGLAAAAHRLPLQAVRDEYAELFLGVGKPEVFLYGSYFVAGALNEAPLVALRHELRALGLERDPALAETEDHVACLCDVMRLLISGDGTGATPLAVQRRFFDSQLRPWAEALCDALAAHPRSDFYRGVAAFARNFFSVEGQAFDMMED